MLSTIAQIPNSIINLNPEIAIIGFTGLAILIIWSMLKHPVLKMIPAPLIVVLVGIGLGRYFDLDHEHMYLFLPDAHFLPHHEATIGPAFLVAISEDFMSSFYFPDFSKILTIEFWEAVVSICLVGSLESLLSTMAVDKLDPFKRHSNLDKDLTAVGAGNLLCGLIGGLPMIAEIVRSSANVNNGARTNWANFFHGVLLLIFVALFPRLIHSIPLAALASLLVFTGFRLASPKEFGKVLGLGKDQLLLFLITIVGVIATDLLLGVVIGIVTKFALHSFRGVKITNLFSMIFELTPQPDDRILITIHGAAIFSNMLALKTAIQAIDPKKTIIFQLNDTFFIDHTVMEFFHDCQHNAEKNGGQCDFVGLEYHEAFADHPLAARRIKPHLA